MLGLPEPFQKAALKAVKKFMIKNNIKAVVITVDDSETDTDGLKFDVREEEIFVMTRQAATDLLQSIDNNKTLTNG